MKFAVGDKVVITGYNNLWNDTKAVVKEVDPTEGEFPYIIELLSDTLGGHKAGYVSRGWPDANLSEDTDLPENALAVAIELLEKHGFAYRIFGAEDVHKLLDRWTTDMVDPRDTTTYRDRITAHVMEGDDWKDMSDPTNDAESTLWNIIFGTEHDHPEWFPSVNGK